LSATEAHRLSVRERAAFDARPFAKREFDPAFALDVGRTGWIGLGWPEKFGGQARSPLEQIAFIETMEQAEAPRIGAVKAAALDTVPVPRTAVAVKRGVDKTPAPRATVAAKGGNGRGAAKKVTRVSKKRIRGKRRVSK